MTAEFQRIQRGEAGRQLLTKAIAMWHQTGMPKHAETAEALLVEV